MNESVQGRVTGFLGLCMRAGQMQSGQEACVSLIRSGEAALVLMDDSSSDNTKKRIIDACQSHAVPLWQLAANALGQAIGKRGRMVAALPKGRMADNVLSILQGEPCLVPAQQTTNHLSEYAGVQAVQ